MALQAQALGLATHAMAGIDTEAARRVLQLPDHWTVQALVAVGQRGDATTLPPIWPSAKCLPRASLWPRS
jgi:hypothetical protein